MYLQVIGGEVTNNRVKISLVNVDEKHDHILSFNQKEGLH